MVVVRRHLRIPAELERLAEVRAVVREVCADCATTSDCMGDLVQAVDEVATNIIRHGYRGGPGWIDVTAELIGDDIVITVEDEAPAFDPTTVVPPDLSVHPGQRRPGGMGIHLIRHAVDRFEHRPRPGGGNILTLVRSRVPRSKEG
jgi:anti-sigma regulatory factor (Ser/Thr protein kinase)